MIDFNLLKPDYEFYSGTYKGTIITQSSFEFYIEQANQIIWEYIYLNAYLLEDETADEYKSTVLKLKLAQCNMADFIGKYGTTPSNNAKEVVSESAGKVSVQYASVANSVANNVEKYQRNIVKKYLADTGLLYKGVG